MAELARAEVALEVDFAHLDEDIKRGLEQRVRAAAKKAQAELDATEVAAAALGDTIDKQVGGKAEAAAQKVRQAARKVQKDLSAAGEAAKATGTALEDAGDATKSIRTGTARTVAEMVRLETAARKAAAAAQTARKALDEPQGALFDLDTGKVVEVQRDLKGVQDALFDLDTVELDKIEKASDRAATSLRSRLAVAAQRARTALAAIRARNSGLDEVGESADKLGRSMDRSGLSLDKFSGRLSILASAIAAAATAAPVLVAGGAGIGAVFALAVPTISAVIKAQDEMADRWGSLSRDQKIAAVSTQKLVRQYKAVADAVAPEVIDAYNAAVSETTRILPRLEPLAKTSATALTDAIASIGQGLDSPRATEFFKFLQANAGPAIGQATDLLGDLGGAAVSTIEALAPLASTGLGLVSMLARLVTALNDINPAFAQLVTLGVALRSPLSALGTFLGKSADKATTFATSTGKATGAARLLNIVAGAGPNLYLAAGTALAFFAVKALTAKSAIDKTISSINAQNRAFGNNIAGYLDANAQFQSRLLPLQQRLATATREVGRETSFTTVQLYQGAKAADALAGTPLRAAMDRNFAAIERVRTAANSLVDQGFAPSQTAAIELADAAGVNLSKALDSAGNLSASAASRIANYAAAARTAASATAIIADGWSRASNAALGLEDRIKGLNDALFASNAANDYLGATLRFNEAVQTADKALEAHEKALRSNDEAERKNILTKAERNRLVFDEIAALNARRAAELTATQATVETDKATFNLLPKLYNLAGGSREAGRDIYALARSMQGATQDASGAVTVVDALGHRIKVLPNGKVIKLKADSSQAEAAAKRARNAIDGLKDKTVNINVVTNAINQAARVQSQIQPRASGGLIRRAAGGLIRGPGTTTSDSIPAIIRGGGFALLSDYEFIVNARSTKRYLPLLKAINADRFARGGQVGVRRYATGGRVDPAAHRIAIALDLRVTANVEKQLASRVKAIGDAVGKDFIKSLSAGSASEIDRAVRSVEKKITSAFSGIHTKVDDRLIARLEVQNKRLSDLAKRRDTIAQQIEDATQLAADVTSRSRTFAAITSFDEAQQASARTITDTLRQRLAAITDFQKNIQSLTRRGLDKGVLRQLLEAGVDEGGQLARLLANSSQGDLAQISSLQRQIDTATKNLGTQSADLLFDAGKAAGKGFLAGLKAEQAEIIKLMTDIAKSVSQTVKKTLKIKSPSRVLEQDGINTMAGYIRGVQRLARRARSAVAAGVQPSFDQLRAAAPTRVAAGAGALAGSRATAGPRVVHHHSNQFTINQAYDPKAVAHQVETRLLAGMR